MENEPSVHDNTIYAYSVDCAGKRIVLHTSFQHVDPIEFTDVIFRDVVAHSFYHVLPENILFDVAETDLAALVSDEESLFTNSSPYGWPPVEYSGDVSTLAEALVAAGARAYLIHSSYGLAGWVLAGSCERVARSAPAALA